MQFNNHQRNGVAYVALGDSYTIGEGVDETERWPNMLTAHLQREGAQIQIVANPSMTGWTTQDVIDKELPVFDESSPTFVTLLIGVNDFVQGVDKEIFKKNLRNILDHIQKKLPQKNHIILITIPDFSVTPAGSHFGEPDAIRKGLTEFNTIIKTEGGMRDLSVVDIFSLSQEMSEDSSLIVSDGLHPSGREYKKWEEHIFPVVYELLKGGK